MSRRPPSVAPAARHALTLCYIDATPDRRILAAARRDLMAWGEAVPTYGLPAGHDPVMYQWPVAGRNVAIYGALDRPRLMRLLAALSRDGSLVASGVDTVGHLHFAAVPIREAA